MKITKKANVSSTAQIKASNQLGPDYAEAQKHIRAAIDCLGKQAKENVLAKESIANLSVVLLDLM